MDAAVVNRLAAAFFDSVLTEDEDVIAFILAPRQVDQEVVAYAGYYKDTWGGVLVDNVDVWRSQRLEAARELWMFRKEDGKQVYRMEAAVYVLRLWEDDRLLCAWKERRSGWVWQRDQLEKSYPVVSSTDGRFL